MRALCSAARPRSSAALLCSAFMAAFLQDSHRVISQRGGLHYRVKSLNRPLTASHMPLSAQQVHFNACWIEPIGTQNSKGIICQEAAL